MIVAEGSFERIYLGSRAPRQYLYLQDRLRSEADGSLLRCVHIDMDGCWFVPDHVTTPTVISDDVEGLELIDTSTLIGLISIGELTFADH